MASFSLKEDLDRLKWDVKSYQHWDRGYLKETIDKHKSVSSIRTIPDGGIGGEC